MFFLMNSASEPRKSTYSEKHFPIEPDFQDFPVWRTWKPRFCEESEENGGEGRASEEEAKCLAHN